MNKRKRIVIIGATSSIAEHCARLWTNENPSETVLIGRSLTKLEQIASDLKVRSPQTLVTTFTTDFLDPDKIQTIVNQVFENGPVDIALIAHGYLPNQEICQTNLNKCREAIELNAISPIMFAEAFINHMEKVNSGVVAIIGSVAGDRGRKSNYIYGAAKSLVERYSQGLQHRLDKSKVRALLIKPGPTDTPMTKQLKINGMRLTSVEVVAKDIVRGINDKRSVIYTPKKWRLIMFVLTALPGVIFNKLEI